MPSVLLAEDDEEYREYLRLVLAGGPYRVVEAADGDAAWWALRRYRPAVAVLDLDMPRRGGLDLVRSVRADPELRGTYLIVLTGLRRAEEAQASLAAGADRHLMKPYPADELRRAVTQGLALAGHPEPPGTPPDW